jgi:type VI secretion system protein ImpK
MTATTKTSENKAWNPDDPETTIVRLPNPGGRLSNTVKDGNPPAALVLRPAGTPSSLSVELPEVDLRNPLLAAAHTLFTLVPRLRRTAAHPDPMRLRKQLIQQLQAFEQRARERGVTRERTLAARYALCSLLDEVIMSTPWGHGSIWNTQGLLVTFHQEVFGGEKFFQLLHRILPDPGGNKDLLEFLYACLALGFQGRYRLIPNGREQLDALRLRVGQAVQRVHGEFERELSPTWRGASGQFQVLRGSLPLWVSLAGLGALLVGGFLCLSATLNSRSDQQFQALHALRSEALLPRRELAAVSPRAEAEPIKLKILSGFLAPEISARLLTVEELPERSTVRISGDNLFASGSAAMNTVYQPVLIRIAAALNDVEGQIMITGHTDDRPIHSLRFPSNWDLSQARARAVLQILARRLKASNRLSFEGRGATEPVAPNDIVGNRARNRRVEITLLTAAVAK